MSVSSSIEQFFGNLWCRLAQPEESAGSSGDVVQGIKSRCGVAWADEAPVVVPVPFASARAPASPDGSVPGTNSARKRSARDRPDSGDAPTSEAQPTAGGETPTRRTQGTPPASARSEVSCNSDDMSSEEKAREKNRLQRLLKDFAKESVAGIPVSLLTPHDGRKSPCFFQMDRSLTVFSVRPGDGSAAEFMAQEVFVKDVAAIYKGPEVVARLPYLGSIANACVGLDTSRDSRLFFHFDDNFERDRFYTCLQILRMSVDINTQS